MTPIVGQPVQFVQWICTEDMYNLYNDFGNILKHDKCNFIYQSWYNSEWGSIMENFYPPKKIIKYLKAVLIIFQIPFLCLAYLFLQILKRIAPGVAYKIVTSKMLGPLGINQWNNSEDIQSVDDMNFMFSSEIFKVKCIDHNMFVFNYFKPCFVLLNFFSLYSQVA